MKIYTEGLSKKILRQVLTGFFLTPVFAVLIVSLVPVLPLQAGQHFNGESENSLHRDEIENWRAVRHASLASPDSYLSQVGLEWLRDGENRVGSAPDNDIRLAGGPAYWGSVFLNKDDQLYFERADDNNVRINGGSQTRARLIPDTEGEPSIVRAETVSFHVIKRGSYALRIKDSQSRSLLGFVAVENYSIDEAWRIDGRFIPAEPGTTIEIVNVLGQVNASKVAGMFEFDIDRKPYSLLGLTDEEAGDIWFIFADRTSGRGTYGAGRFLHSEAMPVDGRLTVDFNKAYNPPCAFSPYSTCPLPPQRNRLDLLVTAGEKDFHPE